MKAIELIRVSTEGQAAQDRAGIPAQREINRKTAKAYGLEIVRSIEMADVSGASVLFAPEMQELLRLIQSPDIHGVVAREFSRLMRPENFEDFKLLQAFADTRTMLYLPEGPIDLTSKMGRMWGGIRALMAGMEISEIKERMWAGKESMRRAGKFPCGDHILPYGVGYDRKTNKFYYKPEAEKVAEVFRRLLSGESNYNRLSDYLGLSRGSVKNILTNPIYMGWRVIDQKRDMSPAARRVRHDGRQADRRKVKRAPDEIIRVQVIDKPLVSEAAFNRAQWMIKRKTEQDLRMRVKVGHFTYNGFLWCAKCDDRMHTFRNQFDRYYYICSNRKRRDEAGQSLCPSSEYLNRNKLEAMLDDLFYERLTSRAFIATICRLQRELAEQRGSKARMARLQQQVESLRTKRKRVIDLYVEGAIGREDRTARIEQIDRDLRSVTDLLAQQTMPVLDAEALAMTFVPFKEWKFLGRDEKRAALAAIAVRVRVADYVIYGLHLGISASCNSGSRVKTAQ